MLLADVRPGPDGVLPESFVRFGDRVHFFGFGGGGEPQVWKTDGTEAGTLPAPEMQPLGLANRPYQLVAAGDTMFIGLLEGDGPERFLWVTGGAPESAVALTGGQSPRQLTPHHGVLLYSLFSPGQQVWRSDGFAAGTYQVEDVNQAWTNECPFPPCFGPPITSPDHLVSSGPWVYFLAFESPLESQLWRTDGTAEGTRVAGGFDEAPRQLTDLAGTLLFVGFDDETGWEPWRSDGTPAGTRLVVDLVPGAGSSEPEQLTRAGDHVYFVLRGEDEEYQLWRTDGTAAGTVLLSELRIRGSGSRGGLLAASGKRRFFTAENPRTGEELWVSDGSDAGIHLVTDLLPGPVGARPRHLTAAGGGVLFAADDGVHGQEVWYSDGSAAGTRLVADVAPGLDGSDPSDFTVVGGRVFFAAGDAELAASSSLSTPAPPASASAHFARRPGEPPESAAPRSSIAGADRESNPRALPVAGPRHVPLTALRNLARRILS
jgi:ELWxxDGT repeat protein